jgi:hypothetical protein
MREKLSEDITSFVDEAGPQALEDFDPTRYEREATKDDSSSTGSKASSGFGLLSGANWLDDKWLFQAIGGESDESDSGI